MQPNSFIATFRAFFAEHKQGHAHCTTFFLRKGGDLVVFKLAHLGEKQRTYVLRLPLRLTSANRKVIVRNGRKWFKPFSDWLFSLPTNQWGEVFETSTPGVSPRPLRVLPLP